MRKLISLIAVFTLSITLFSCQEEVVSPQLPVQELAVEETPGAENTGSDDVEENTSDVKGK